MANLYPKSEKAEQSFDAIYSAIQTKGGTGATQNIIDTYADAIDTITLNNDNFIYHQTGGTINRIDVKFAIPDDIGTEYIGGLAPQPITKNGFNGGTLYEDVILPANIKHINSLYDWRRGWHAKSVWIKLSVIPGAVDTFSDNCLTNLLLDESITFDSQSIAGNLGHIEPNTDDVTINMPNASYGFAGYVSGNQLNEPKTRKIKFGNVSVLTSVAGWTDNGGFKGFHADNTVFSALTEIWGTGFCGCTGTIILPVLHRLDNRFGEESVFVNDCQFSSIYFGGELRIMSATNIQCLKDIQTTGTNVYIPTGNSDTKTKFDENGIPYIQQNAPEVLPPT